MQFKKCTHLFLAILLLISNLGLAFNIHYCGDRIMSFSAVVSTSIEENFDKSNCCCAEDLTNNSCCEDKVVDLKEEAKEVIVEKISFQIAAPFLISNPLELITPNTSTYSPSRTFIEYYCVPNALPLFKLYNQYIFYA